GLLPGAMLRNRGLKFICEDVCLRVEQNDTPFTVKCTRGQILRVPINHGEGNYYAEPALLARLEAERRIVFRYCSARGEVTDSSNPNGSADAIAGICSERRNVVGMMPHPERACETPLGSEDGRVLFDSVLSALAGNPQIAQAAETVR
ncbi:MAG: phosphoribosylformylglycinamidine synthase subunit PurQ, partial [Vicinamibacterales bacterium]